MPTDGTEIAHDFTPISETNRTNEQRDGKTIRLQEQKTHSQKGRGGQTEWAGIKICQLCGYRWQLDCW